MDIDRLFKMSSDELDQHLETEVEKIIMSAPPEMRDRLRAVHNGARMQVRAAKNLTDAMVRTNESMLEKMQELGNALREALK